MVDAFWVMLPRLRAEAQLDAVNAAASPHMSAQDRRAYVRRLETEANAGTPVRAATHADLAGMGIRVVSEQ